MDTFIVTLIVALAVGFTIRGFVRAYKGERQCSCTGCSCASKEGCSQSFPMDSQAPHEN